MPSQYGFSGNTKKVSVIGVRTSFSFSGDSLPPPPGSSLTKMMEDDNRRNAKLTQARVVLNIESRIIRVKSTTGRLLQATASGKNRQVLKDSWHVGMVDHLDKSQARYWRTIEQGSWGSRTPSWSHPFAGTVLEGVFGDTVRGFRQTRWGKPRALAAGPFTLAGSSQRFGAGNALLQGKFSRRGGGVAPVAASRQGKFVPFSSETLNKILRARHRYSGGSAKTFRPYSPPKVRHEIQATYAYEDAYRQVGLPLTEQEVARLLRYAGLRFNVQQGSAKTRAGRNIIGELP